MTGVSDHYSQTLLDLCHRFEFPAKLRRFEVPVKEHLPGGPRPVPGTGFAVVDVEETVLESGPVPGVAEVFAIWRSFAGATGPSYMCTVSKTLVEADLGAVAAKTPLVGQRSLGGFVPTADDAAAISSTVLPDDVGRNAAAGCAVPSQFRTQCCMAGRTRRFAVRFGFSDAG
ncbi:unnamed protein product [Effrenium voratum]|nr:unnamed protein product [Effrenium voratum]